MPWPWRPRRRTGRLPTRSGPIEPRPGGDDVTSSTATAPAVLRGGAGKAVPGERWLGPADGATTGAGPLRRPRPRRRVRAGAPHGGPRRAGGPRPRRGHHRALLAVARPRRRARAAPQRVRPGAGHRSVGHGPAPGRQPRHRGRPRGAAGTAPRAAASRGPRGRRAGGRPGARPGPPRGRRGGRALVRLGRGRRATLLAAVGPGGFLVEDCWDEDARSSPSAGVRAVSVEPATPGSVARRALRGAVGLGPRRRLHDLLRHRRPVPPGPGPRAWFHWPSRPAGLYRLNQGLHVITGIAAIPLLLAKLWVVFPKLFARPSCARVAHGARAPGPPAARRGRPLPARHRGGQRQHLAALATSASGRPLRRGVDRHGRARHPRGRQVGDHPEAPAGTQRHGRRRAADRPRPGGLGRRGFLDGRGRRAGPGSRSCTVGQTVRPAAAPRRPRPPAPTSDRRASPSTGPPPRSASPAWISTPTDWWSTARASPGRCRSPTTSCVALPQREAKLPIACVEGWSTSQRWRGVPVRDLLALAGAREGAEATVVSIHESARLRDSEVTSAQAATPTRCWPSR